MGFTLSEAFERIAMPLYHQSLITQTYTQKYRIYHNLDHIKQMLSLIPDGHPETEILIDAILFHDYVYADHPVANGVNEALSASEYFFYNMKFLAAFDTPFGANGDGSLEYERRVIAAITATAHHDKDQKFLNETAKIVCDLDLFSFSLPWEEYNPISERVLQENKIIYNDVEQINNGRRHFYQTLLNRKQLYYVFSEWEKQARENITKSLDEMK